MFLRFLCSAILLFSGLNAILLEDSNISRQPAVAAMDPLTFILQHSDIDRFYRPQSKSFTIFSINSALNKGGFYSTYFSPFSKDELESQGCNNVVSFDELHTIYETLKARSEQKDNAFALMNELGNEMAELGELLRQTVNSAYAGAQDLIISLAKLADLADARFADGCDSNCRSVAEAFVSELHRDIAQQAISSLNGPLKKFSKPTSNSDIKSDFSVLTDAVIVFKDASSGNGWRPYISFYLNPTNPYADNSVFTGQVRGSQQLFYVSQLLIAGLNFLYEVQTTSAIIPTNSLIGYSTLQNGHNLRGVLWQVPDVKVYQHFYNDALFGPHNLSAYRLHLEAKNFLVKWAEVINLIITGIAASLASVLAWLTIMRTRTPLTFSLARRHVIVSQHS